uniref:Uncharacterized protein n=1 Tax=Anguilla anguilla TaxID=7936 RepID=A0A0E9W339_ANGAN
MSTRLKKSPSKVLERARACVRACAHVCTMRNISVSTLYFYFVIHSAFDDWKVQTICNYD